MEVIEPSPSHRHGTLDCRVRIVVHDLEVLDRVVEDGCRLPLDDQLRQAARLPRELLLDLVEVVAVDVHITTRPDELSDFQIALLRHHVGQQRVAGDVEGHAQEHVSTALVQLARKPPICHVELEERVARLQLHLRQVGHVPGRHDDASRVGARLDELDRSADLIDRLAIGRSPAAPLNAVHRPQVAVLVGPLIPDVDVLLQQGLDVRLAAQEPKQLLCDQAERHRLGGDEGEALGQVVADLAPKHAQRAGASAVSLLRALGEDVTQKILVCRSTHVTPMNKAHPFDAPPHLL